MLGSWDLEDASTMGFFEQVMSEKAVSRSKWVAYGFDTLRQRYPGYFATPFGPFSASQLLAGVYGGILLKDDAKISKALAVARDRDELDAFIHQVCKTSPNWYYFQWCQRKLVIGHVRPVVPLIRDGRLHAVTSAHYSTAKVAQCQICWRREDDHVSGFGCRK